MIPSIDEASAYEKCFERHHDMIPKTNKMHGSNLTNRWIQVRFAKVTCHKWYKMEYT